MGFRTVGQRTPAEKEQAVRPVGDRVPTPEAHLSGFGRGVEVVGVAIQDAADLAAGARLLFQHHELGRDPAHSRQELGLGTVAKTRRQREVAHLEFRVGIVRHEVNGFLHELLQIHARHGLKGVVGHELMRSDPLDDLALHRSEPNRHVGGEPVKVQKKARVLVGDGWPRQPDLIPGGVSLRPKGRAPSLV